MRILYDSKNPIFKSPYGCIRENEECTISIHIPQSCNTKRVFLCLEGAEDTKTELNYSTSYDMYNVYTASFAVAARGLYFYYFYIETQDTNFALYRYGFSDTNIEDGQKWQLSCIPEDFKVCDQYKGRVMYQIFPDRFYKSGDCSLNGKLEPYTLHTCTKDVPHYLPDENGEILNNDFFGGNLKGIAAKLPYLKSLGVGIIYLNPIFKAFSNHRYDTCDYKTIDPMLGNEDDFAELCRLAHSLDMKIILDGVFSHTGSDSIYFDSKNRFGTGVMSNPNSPYKSWYTLCDNGEYDSWWGIKTLPCVNELSPSFVNYIIKDEDSVVKHWLRLGADGYRLDVADELPDEFIRLLHEEVHKTKPGALVLGEVWEDASNKIAYDIRRRYFTDGELDSVMNYPFREAITDLVTGKISANDFSEKILTITENYPKEVTDCLMNSLSTHDTPRIMTILSGAPTDMDRYASSAYSLSSEEIQRARELIVPAAALQFFLPGTACIYYGDETGTFGFGDPFNRGYFNWFDTQNSISDLYRELASLKNKFSPFKEGTLHFYPCDDGVLKMERRDGNTSVFMEMNLSSNSYIARKTPLIMSRNASPVDKGIAIHQNGFIIYEINQK